MSSASSIFIHESCHENLLTFWHSLAGDHIFDVFDIFGTKRSSEKCESLRLEPVAHQKSMQHGWRYSSYTHTGRCGSNAVMVSAPLIVCAPVLCGVVCAGVFECERQGEKEIENKESVLLRVSRCGFVRWIVTQNLKSRSVLTLTRARTHTHTHTHTYTYAPTQAGKQAGRQAGVGINR